MQGRQRRAVAAQIARDQGGVVSRLQLRTHGISAEDVRAEVRADRWALHGNQTVAIHTRELSGQEQHWRAIWEVGRRIAALDGVTALLAAGLTGYDDPTIHLSVPHTCRVKVLAGVRIHKITRRGTAEVAEGGIPRVRAPIATIRAAHWAKTDRQASLLLLLPVQQGLVSPEQLLLASKSTAGRQRRALVKAVVADVTAGVRTLGELDFARLCRQHGLPEPDRQVVRRRPSGRAYLDVRWACGLVVEIDGVHHLQGLTPMHDHLRQNDVTLGSDVVLRFDNLGLRLDPAPFMAQVREGLRALGGLR